jgi:predicted solute-binding protein
MRAIVGREGADQPAASTSQMGRFETEWLASDANLAALDSIISAQSEFSPKFCAEYFHDYLRFRFAEREKQGLVQFRSLCEKHGILPRNPGEVRLA